LARNKLKKFKETSEFYHFFQPTRQELLDGFELRGKWNEIFFKNDVPLIIEIGCGRGEYVVELSQKFPNKNFIGIDKKGARMWTGAKYTIEQNITNVAFLRILAEDVNLAFAPNEVDEIWITFPEPQPKKSKEAKRFTSPEFLKRYAQILKPNAVINLKTDNTDFFNYTLSVIEKYNHEILHVTEDLYAQNNLNDNEILNIKTHYESIWLDKGLTIKYLKFRLK
jgi:tRNA (guanine-N7-)-methyltransferase